MKRSLTKLFISTFIASISFLSMSFIEDIPKKEMIISMPMLTDKNAEIVKTGLKNLNGIGDIEVCYQLNVVIISYDEKTETEEHILETIRKQEINSTVELLNSRDIPKIRSEFHTDKIK